MWAFIAIHVHCADIYIRSVLTDLYTIWAFRVSILLCTMFNRPYGKCVNNRANSTFERAQYQNRFRCDVKHSFTDTLTDIYAVCAEYDWV